MKTLISMMQAANADVPRISIEKAREPVTNNALVVDVRDASEVEKAGKIARAARLPGHYRRLAKACLEVAGRMSLRERTVIRLVRSLFYHL